MTRRHAIWLGSLVGFLGGLLLLSLLIVPGAVAGKWTAEQPVAAQR